MTQVDRAYSFVRGAIERGEYPVGGALPTQPALARSIGVSTVTLRQALEKLAEQGFIEASQGRGTFVRSQHAVGGPILVADDDEAVRAMLVAALKHLGYEVEAVDGGELAVERVRQRKFSHVLLDLRMGALDGAAAGEQVARLDPRAIVVYVTAHPIELFESKPLGSGPALVLRKPFELDDLERVLQLRHR